MPKVTARFSIEFLEKPQAAFANSVPITDIPAFREIEGLGFAARYDCTNPRIKIEVPESDPRIPSVLAILARCGFRCSPHKIPNLNTNFHEFTIERRRDYSSAEIDAAPLLRLAAKGSWNPIADDCYPASKHWPSRPRSPAESLRWMREHLGDDESGWRIKANARLKKKSQIGQLPSGAFLISTELKSQLEAANLHGLRFTPVRYDRPEKAARQLWQFGNSLEMPNCLVPRLTQIGEDVSAENENDGAMWNEGGYRPEELTFDRKSVEALGPIDVAVTREKVGSHGGFMHRELIVSQRFRRILAELRIHSVGYVPVRLVN